LNCFLKILACEGGKLNVRVENSSVRVENSSVRVENSSLVELAGIFLEIMENKSVKPGTCILITSLSYLSRVGAAAYASEWRVAVSMLVSRWAGVLVCPVFPLHFSEIPGTLFGEMLILHTWFRNMYAGTHLGLQSAWDRYTEILLELVEGSGSLDSPEYLSPLLPSSLDPRSSFVPTHFSTSSTSPAIIFGLDRKYTYELLLSLTVSLRRGFSMVLPLFIAACALLTVIMWAAAGIPAIPLM
jgi:hypothetical protein